MVYYKQSADFYEHVVLNLHKGINDMTILTDRWKFTYITLEE